MRASPTPWPRSHAAESSQVEQFLVEPAETAVLIDEVYLQNPMTLLTGAVFRRIGCFEPGAM